MRLNNNRDYSLLEDAIQNILLNKKDIDLDSNEKLLRNLWSQFRREIHHCIVLKDDSPYDVPIRELDLLTNNNRYKVKISQKTLIFNNNGEPCNALGSSIVYEKRGGCYVKLFTVGYNCKIKHEEVMENYWS